MMNRNRSFEHHDDEKRDDESEDEGEIPEHRPTSSDNIDEANSKSRSKKIAEAYDDAMEIVKYEKDREKPKVLISRAYSALDSIDLLSKHFKTPEVKEALESLVKKVNEILKVIEE